MRPFERVILLLLGSLCGRWVLATEIEPRREYFYVGGTYKNITTGNTTDLYMLNQIYVEKFTPPHPSQPYPIVFIAGGGQTSTNFLETPDGRPGWLSYFISRGYTVYLTDQPSRGRSAWHPSQGPIYVFSATAISSQFTATSSHDQWPQAHLHTQWPGSGVPGDPIFDAFYATQVQSIFNRTLTEKLNTDSYTALLDRIGTGTIILTHSQSGPYGWRLGDVRPDLVKGIIALEPTGPPFENVFPTRSFWRVWGITDLEIDYEPSTGVNGTALNTTRIPAIDSDHSECILQADPPKKLKNLSRVPVLVVTAEASQHAVFDYCTVDYLRQAGVQVEFADLAKEGIKGNGHFMFMEKNNMEVADRVYRWLKQQ
ncbi:Alpha/Beta hydrolase protein [Massariosphaeria phaeospora]|uniref:Alpha/Beta hydrolase protein n=1 Tax=Massariosphaeria phaeospora TaxID=100035 RepID=A0A7C8I851_9PLEO|nr:Alpha/Beta hydrolase protein [Massariosphaeria phaeospora]